jgi:hypothetical protein
MCIDWQIQSLNVDPNLTPPNQFGQSCLIAAGPRLHYGFRAPRPGCADEDPQADMGDVDNALDVSQQPLTGPAVHGVL